MDQLKSNSLHLMVTDTLLDSHHRKQSCKALVFVCPMKLADLQCRQLNDLVVVSIAIACICLC